MSDPAVAHSVEVNHAPFNRAFNVDCSAWEFFSRPEEKARQHRFGIAMQGVASLEPADNILKGMSFSRRECSGANPYQALSGHPYRLMPWLSTLVGVLEHPLWYLPKNFLTSTLLCRIFQVL